MGGARRGSGGRRCTLGGRRAWGGRGRASYSRQAGARGGRSAPLWNAVQRRVGLLQLEDKCGEEAEHVSREAGGEEAVGHRAGEE